MLLFVLTFLAACTVTVESATDACYASCATQQKGCSTLDMEGCQGLCDYVIASIEETPSCLQLGTESWECDTTIEWECSMEYDIVGNPLQNSCQEESTAFEAAGCLVEE